jgi:hypothetical protein
MNKSAIFGVLDTYVSSLSTPIITPSLKVSLNDMVLHNCTQQSANVLDGGALG